MGGKISLRQAQQVKQQYLSLSPLESLGIFDHPETELSKEEREVLLFVNHLDPKQAADLVLSLDSIESILEDKDEEVPSGFQRDIKNLEEKGIDFSDKDRISFIYGLLYTKLDKDEDREGNIITQARDLARLKTVSRIEPVKKGDIETALASRKDLLTDHELQNLVTTSVYSVEKFITQYFAHVGMFIEHFMPMTIETDAGVVEMCIPDTHDNFPFSSLKFKKYEQYSEFMKSIRYSERIKSMGRTLLTRSELEFKVPNVRNTEEIANKTRSKIIVFSIGGQDIHKALKVGVFGLTVPSPYSPTVDITEEEEEAVVNLDDEKFWREVKEQEGSLRSRKLRRKLRSALKYLAKEIGHKGQLDKGDLSNAFLNRMAKNGWFENRYRMEEFFERAHPLFDDFFSPSYCQDCHYTISDDLSEISMRVVERTKAIVDWTNVLEQREPLFVFKNFNEDSYSLRTYKQFWNTLDIYAQVPQRVNEVLLNTFRDNYLADPSINLEQYLLDTQESLNDFRDVLSKAKEMSRLPGVIVPDTKMLPESAQEEAP